MSRLFGLAALALLMALMFTAIALVQHRRRDGDGWWEVFADRCYRVGRGRECCPGIVSHDADVAATECRIGHDPIDQRGTPRGGRKQAV